MNLKNMTVEELIRSSQDSDNPLTQALSSKLEELIDEISEISVEGNNQIEYIKRLVGISNNY